MGCGIANKDGPGPDCLPSFWFHAYNISTASSHWTAMAQPAIMGNSNLDWHESLYSTPSTARNPATLFVWHNKNDADQQSRGIQPPKPTWLTWKWCQSGVHGRSVTITFHDKIILQSCLCHMQRSARIRNYMTKPSWGGTSFTWGVATATLPVEQFVSAAICRFRSTPIVVASRLQIEL